MNAMLPGAFQGFPLGNVNPFEPRYVVDNSGHQAPMDAVRSAAAFPPQPDRHATPLRGRSMSGSQRQGDVVHVEPPRRSAAEQMHMQRRVTSADGVPLGVTVTPAAPNRLPERGTTSFERRAGYSMNVGVRHAGLREHHEQSRGMHRPPQVSSSVSRNAVGQESSPRQLPWHIRTGNVHVADVAVTERDPRNAHSHGEASTGSQQTPASTGGHPRIEEDRSANELPPVSSNDMQQESPASPDPAIAAETVGTAGEHGFVSVAGLDAAQNCMVMNNQDECVVEMVNLETLDPQEEVLVATDAPTEDLPEIESVEPRRDACDPLQGGNTDEPQRHDENNDADCIILNSAEENHAIRCPRLVCGLERCTSHFLNHENFVSHLRTDHKLPTYVTTITFDSNPEYQIFAQALFGAVAFRRIGKCSAEKTTYMCPYEIAQRNSRTLRLVKASKGKMSPYFDEDFGFTEVDRTPRDVIIRQGGVCPAFMVVIKEPPRYIVKICDRHLHGPEIPQCTFDMVAKLVLLQDVTVPVMQRILRGLPDLQTSSEVLEERLRSLSLQQVSAFCKIIRSSYRSEMKRLRINHVPMDLTPFEIRQEEDDDIIEVYPGPGEDLNCYNFNIQMANKKKRKRRALPKPMKNSNKRAKKKNTK